VGLEPGQKVVAVGCGPGSFTIPAGCIVAEEGSAVALDVNPLAVEHVQQKTAAEGVTNARVIVTGAARTELSEGSFDLGFVFCLARSIGDTAAMWDKLHRLLQSVKRRERNAQFRRLDCAA